MSENILRSDVIKAINTGLPWRLSYVTADKRRGTGGEYISLSGWQKLTKENAPKAGRLGDHEPARDLAHTDNRSFVAFHPAKRNKHMRTIHYRLIVLFNGKNVLNG